MKKKLKYLKIIFIFIISLNISCSMKYWKNRAYDFTDFAHIDLNIMGGVAACYAGPFVLGAMAFDYDMGCRYILGLGGIQKIKFNETSINSGIIFPFNRLKEKGRSEIGYNNNSPPWGAIGFDFGVILGIGFRIDFVEFADFVSGLFYFDFLKDDLFEKEKQSNIKVE